MEIPLDVPDGLYPAIDKAVDQALDEPTLRDLEAVLGVPSPTPAVRERLRHAVCYHLLTTTPADGSGGVLMVRWVQVRRHLEQIEKASAALARASTRLAALVDPLAGAEPRERAERGRARGMIQAVGGNRLAADMLRLGDTLRDGLPLLAQIEQAARKAPGRIPPSAPRRGPGRRDALAVPLLAELIVLLERHRGPGADTVYTQRDESGMFAGHLYGAVAILAPRLPRSALAAKKPQALVRMLTRYRPAARRLAPLLASRQP